MKLIHHISHPGSKRSLGNKAASLYKMHKLGFTVPETYVIGKNARDSFSIQKEQVRAQLQREIRPLAEPGTSWAIRSSCEVEDHHNHSFAGQFATILDVKGTNDILDSIEKVWDSGNKVREGLYMKASSAENKPLGMAVILQEMVRAVWSGVAFSINPVTGRQEIVIEAVKGGGAKLVQDGVKPFRCIWYQDTCEYDSEPEQDFKGLLESLVHGIKKLHKAFGGAVDVEWAFDGRNLFYLQCRKVTVSEFPTIYSNHISREVLPGMIKPLVWSVNIPLVNSAWIRLLEGLLGRLNIEPEQLSKSFYYRAYFNMGTLGALFRRMGLPNDSLESLMGRKNPSGKSSFRPSLKTIRYLPPMLGFGMSMVFLEKRFKKEHARIAARTDQLYEKMKETTAADYDRCFKEISTIVSAAAFFNIIIPLSFQVSNRILQNKLKRCGIPFETLDFIRDYPELSAYDPNEHLSKLKQQWASLPAEIQNSVKDIDTLRSSNADPLLKDFLDNFWDIIARFGHFSESGNDFSCKPWREDPDFVLSLVHQPPAGNAATKKAVHSRSALKRVPRRAYGRAGRFRLYREMISSEYTRSYGLFRELFMITGRSFKEKGWLKDPSDVFYLTLDQHNRLIDGIHPDEAGPLLKQVDEVKQEMEGYRDMILPSLIYGDTPPPLPRKDAAMLEGIPTSPGIFAGELVVVRGYEDFDKNVEGKILVIPFSDVGWTPLLVRAGAIVSESGGMLSHASIIARELSVPAISSVDHACNLRDGIKAKIDGYNGTLILSN